MCLSQPPFPIIFWAPPTTEVPHCPDEQHHFQKRQAHITNALKITLNNWKGLGRMFLTGSGPVLYNLVNRKQVPVPLKNIMVLLSGFSTENED
jgi:hypothetical protein